MRISWGLGNSERIANSNRAEKKMVGDVIICSPWLH